MQVLWLNKIQPNLQWNYNKYLCYIQRRLLVPVNAAWQCVQSYLSLHLSIFNALTSKSLDRERSSLECRYIKFICEGHRVKIKLTEANKQVCVSNTRVVCRERQSCLVKRNNGLEKLLTISKTERQKTRQRQRRKYYESLVTCWSMSILPSEQIRMTKDRWLGRTGEAWLPMLRTTWYL